MVDSDPVPIPTSELFRRHAPFVAAFLLRLGAHPDDREDLVQDVFITAHKKGGFVDDGSAKATTWLSAIALRVLSNHRRKLSRRPQKGASVGTTDSPEPEQRVLASHPGSRPDKQVDQRESILQVQAALATLSDELRAIFVMYELQSQSCIEIAKALEIPVGTVYSRLHTARKRFKAAFDRATQGELPPLHGKAGA